MRLYPRLLRRFAAEEFTKQASLSSFELEAVAATAHPLQVWPATGAPRVTSAELLALRLQLVDKAREQGWPASLARDDQRDLDIEVARTLWAHSELTPAEASFGDVWSFLALVLAPDIVWWRAAGSTNVERFVGVDLTRHTLARLWWRAHLFTWGLEAPEEGWELWRSTPIGEADLDQIQTRRGGYGRSPKLFRVLVRLYPFATTLATEAGVDRREFWRQAFLRWLLRLGAFTDFGALSEAELEADLAAVARACDPHVLVASRSDDGDDGNDASASEEFDAQLLRTIVVRLAEAVRDQGEVAEGDLGRALERVTGIAVPANREDIVHGIAWQGAALRYLIRTEEDGLAAWRAGSVLPAPDRRWGDWSIDSFKEHVAENGDRHVDDLASELFNGRSGRTVRRVVRAVLRETGEDGR